MYDVRAGETECADTLATRPQRDDYTILLSYTPRCIVHANRLALFIFSGDEATHAIEQDETRRNSTC
jgi:hypothetical protein